MSERWRLEHATSEVVGLLGRSDAHLGKSVFQ